MSETKRDLRSASLPELVLSDHHVELLELLLFGPLSQHDLPIPLANHFPGPRPLALRDREAC